MPSVVDICNRALQKLGASPITALTEDSRNARACNASYEIIRDAELRKHPWSCATSRVQLAPDTATPAFGVDYQYSLPSDFLRILPGNKITDWQIEGRKLLTDDGITLDLRYVKRVTDPNEFDALFINLLATRLAFELCEIITQSNTKKDFLMKDYEFSILEAKRSNAIERVSAESPEDSWITARL
jgi:hypothetical protein